MHAGVGPKTAETIVQDISAGRVTLTTFSDAALEGEVAFLARADSFFLATVSESGWPYVQHRGGPPGFVHVLSATRIAFADFSGNRQYVSVGNAAGEDRTALRLRLKLFGRLRFVDLDDAEPPLAQCASLPGYEATVERIARIDVVAFDWNCPQHIPPR